MPVSFRKWWRTLRFLIIGLILLIPALILNHYARLPGPGSAMRSTLERNYQKRIHETLRMTDWVKSQLISRPWGLLKRDDGSPIAEWFSRRDVALIILEGDSLVCLTDPTLAAGERRIRQLGNEQGLQKLDNAWVHVQTERIGKYSVTGLVTVQRFYSIENEFLRNRFELAPRLSGNYVVSPVESEQGFAVRDLSGESSFWVTLDGEESGRELLKWITGLLYLLLLIAMLAFLSDMLRLGYGLKRTNLWLVALAADLLILRWIMIRFELPGIWYDLPLFETLRNPLFLFSSTGDSLITSLSILFLLYHFYRRFRLWPSRSKTTGVMRLQPRLMDSILFLALGMLFILFMLTELLVDQLLVRSQIVLEIYRVMTVDFYVVTDVVMTLSFHLAFMLMAIRILFQLKVMIARARIMVGYTVTAAIVFGFTRLWGLGPDLFSMGYLLILGLVILYQPGSAKGRIDRTWMTLILVLVTAHTVQHISVTNTVKEKQIQASMLESLSNEHDPIAEMLLFQMDESLKGDTVLRNLVFEVARSMDRSAAEDRITSYLKSNYFNLYWTRYQVNANLCDSSNMLRLITDNLDVPCLDYFTRDVLGRFGQIIEGTGFYYLDNFDGLINYMGWYPVLSRDSSWGYHLIIHVDSRLVTQEVGYPELLIAGQKKRDTLSPHYSYAKYQGGQLTSQAGVYPYASDLNLYPGDIGELVTFEMGSFDHIIYRMDLNNAVLISRPVVRFMDYLVTFSYIFLSFYLAWLLAQLLQTPARKLKWSNLVLKQRIQVTMVIIFVFSFLLAGAGMVYFNLQQYRSATASTIREKTSMLLTELQHKLDKEKVLSPEWQDASYPGLKDLLVKFSFVFNTDIHLYNPEGALLVSSRPELFDRKITSTRMDPSAHYQLSVLLHPSVIHKEKIGSLEYFSSYVPFYNVDRTLLAYLNLPYFSRQREISREITTFIVALLNVYFLLIFLTVFLTVVISNQVTRPLRMLQEKLSALKLGGANQEIAYQRHDEIGSLVKEYNRMVVELQRSAEKLARSERELAWREMARQIAHEIKNPLTPMKLSVQHLRKAWRADNRHTVPDIDKISETLIDQIDTLAAIATEFSRFAQMPGARYEAIDLMEKVKNIATLFGCNIRVLTSVPPYDAQQVLIRMDKEQMTQVLNNLIRNALQAIPEGQEPEIIIRIEKREPSALCSISDNGIGIPENLQEKMFQPNFTTKTSGTGLGLAITRRIVEAAGGRIWFTTEPGKGSTFFVELPLFVKED